MDNGASSYRRYLDGDDAAFDEIMRLWFDRLILFIDRYVHDLYTAEDIATDVFADLVVHHRRYNFQYALSTYLFTLARNRALNHLKRQKRLRFEPLDEQLAERESLEDTVLKTEQHRALHKAIADLPTDMQAAVHLVYFEGLSYDEAGRVMNKNRKQIDNLLSRAKRELRTVLTEEGLTL